MADKIRFIILNHSYNNKLLKFNLYNNGNTVGGQNGNITASMVKELRNDMLEDGLQKL